jgi:hypothetical protein
VVKKKGTLFLARRSKRMVDTNKIRQFVRVSDGRIGVVIANEECGGVFRGHCDVWFGMLVGPALKPEPLVEQLCVREDWEVVEAAPGRTSKWW